MLKIVHRVNSINNLISVPKEYGVEIDIRAYNDKLILNHEPFESGDTFEEYLKHFSHAFMIAEIKCEGIERRVIELLEKHNISNYFLLSVSFPFMWMLSNKGIRKMAVRYSEYEDITTCTQMKGKIDWVWIDTFTKLPLDKQTYRQIKEAGFKICLVCPERWGRPEDIARYKNCLKENNIELDAVMTAKHYCKSWE